MVLILKNHGSTIVIPLELVFHILSMLPVKTLLRFKSVCKDWYNIINDSYFIKLHLYQSLKINSGHDRSLAHTDFKLLYLVDDIDFPCQQTILHCPNEVGSDEIKQVFDVIGSCNGLLCLRSWGKIDGFIICNPSTRSFKWIYMPITHLGKTQYWLRCGFGYDSKKDDFKIVLTLMKGFEIVVFSYSLKSDTWVPSQSLPLYQNIIYQIQCEIIYGNNMLHYLLQVKNEKDELVRIIARFNLCSEQWEADKFFLPKKITYECNNNYNDTVQLGFIDGCLGLCHNHSKSVDIWVMKEYGVERSWTKLFCISQRVHHSSYYDVIGVVNSTRGPEDLLLFCPAGLFWYDQKHKTFKNFKYETFHCQTVHTYVGSLVSIPGCSQMRLENKCSED